jgi:hypothetical protein
MIKNEMPEFPVIYANAGVAVTELFMGLGEPLERKPAAIPQISVNTAAGTGENTGGAAVTSTKGKIDVVPIVEKYVCIF